MVHTAYDTFQFLNNSPSKIDAIESYRSNLLIACSDGSLRVYVPESSVSDQSDFHSETLGLHQGPYVLERTLNGFSRRQMLAMEVLVSRELLLSLSESIALHGLPNLETLSVITKAKGANVYSWDDKRGLLCFGGQKRVCIYKHDGGSGFVEVKEFGVPDTVKSMSWCGENICLGIRREYKILNTMNGVLSEVFSSGRIAAPLVVALPPGELLLGKDNIGVLVNQNGKLIQEGRICWSEAPAVVIIQKPYAIGLLGRHVEIRSLRVPYPLIQTVVLRNVRHLVRSNNTVIVALDNSVFGFFPVPLGAQIVQLTASGNFEEALALCKLLPPEDSSLRSSKEQSIHMRYAHFLFENGSYEEAMEHFVASQVEITYVLALYPSIVVPKSSCIPEPQKFADVADAPYLSRGSSGLSDDLDSPPSDVFESDEMDIESKKMSHNTLMALIKYLQKKRHSVIEKATTEGTEEVVSDAVGDNFISYGTDRSKKPTKGRIHVPITSIARDMAAILDTALLQALFLTGQSSAATDFLKALNYCDVKICDAFLQERSQYACQIELYRCNSMHHEALKLLHQLVEEFKSEQTPVELLTKFKPDMIIEYLKPLCATDPMLVLEFSLPVLESCPMQTIELFLSGNIPADLVNSYLKQHAPTMQATYLELMLAMNENSIPGNLQNEMGIKILLGLFKTVDGCVLDPPKVVDFWRIQHRCSNIFGESAQQSFVLQFHAPDKMLSVSVTMTNALSNFWQVQIYLSEVLDFHAEHNSQKKWDEKTCPPPRKKLLSALESMSGYNPEVLLKRLPPDALYEERAILLGKMNKHELALSIYVHKLHVPELALSYCDRVYDSGLQQHSAKSYGNIYQTLLQIYLNPTKTTKKFEKKITNLVSAQSPGIPKVGLGTTAKVKGGRSKKIAEIGGAEDTRFSLSGTDSGRSDGDTEDAAEEGGSTIMLDQVLDLLSRRWDRIHGAQALKLLPRDTKLQNLLPFLGPLLRKSSEAYRNFSVIKSLRESENLQVKDELYNQRKAVLKITSDSMCSLCNKKIGTSVFAVYPNGKTIVHFVCFRDSQNMKAVGRGSQLRKR